MKNRNQCWLFVPAEDAPKHAEVLISCCSVSLSCLQYRFCSDRRRYSLVFMFIYLFWPISDITVSSVFFLNFLESLFPSHWQIFPSEQIWLHYVYPYPCGLWPRATLNRIDRNAETETLIYGDITPNTKQGLLTSLHNSSWSFTDTHLR